MLQHTNPWLVFDYWLTDSIETLFTRANQYSDSPRTFARADKQYDHMSSYGPNINLNIPPLPTLSVWLGNSL